MFPPNIENFNFLLGHCCRFNQTVKKTSAHDDRSGVTPTNQTWCGLDENFGPVGELSLTLTQGRQKKKTKNAESTFLVLFHK